ncbi:MAG: hypothetical protein PVJ28_10180 [Acidimicrobiia bacterium]
MFIEYSTRVRAGLADVEKSLDAIRASLEEWADVAYREGEHLRARVGPSERMAREVKLNIGIAEIHAYGLVYPVEWTAADAALLFPDLTADLILASRGTHETELTLKGTYQPPLGTLGKLADRTVLHRVAEATVKDWMDRLAAAISVESRKAQQES